MKKWQKKYKKKKSLYPYDSAPRGKWADWKWSHQNKSGFLINCGNQMRVCNLKSHAKDNDFENARTWRKIYKKFIIKAESYARNGFDIGGGFDPWPSEHNEIILDLPIEL